MKLHFIAAIAIFAAVLSAEDFITEREYAKMLYKNPRGIGCDSCHGEKGEGKKIANYRVKNRKTGEMEAKTLAGPAISHLGFSDFWDALKSPRGIMPSYFLTAGEVKALYEYVRTSANSDSTKKDKK